ncbi:polyphenol oxidase I, chloroplastic-like [Durio zibethinus]|uniref:Polyphenol oxidase I, chloroplastic-like n=1 Tax=Durio zibethinus TaxID=66656 RepID=A0A6P5XY90_DURZI|nr:polyphenol oxidase I, chloroplastic-like [Durio zibethinus]
MASLLPSISSNTTIPISFFSPFFPTTSGVSVSKRKKPCTTHKILSCKATKGDQNHINPPSSKNIGEYYPNHIAIDRRNAPFILGGVCGAANVSNFDSSPLERPVSPDLSSCGEPNVPCYVRPFDCCPPLIKGSIDFKPPPVSQLRIRPAAHLVDEHYKTKFARVIELMKALPPEDPRNFMQQANVHCAYCNGAYKQEGYDVQLEIHSSWLFFPFHRLYLYFFERILGNLIDDPDFALPFWNWDHPGGMEMPDMFEAKAYRSLYDEHRNQNHIPPVVVDLNYDYLNRPRPNDEQKMLNLNTMHRQMISNSTTPYLFFGRPYRGGDRPMQGPGSIECMPHNTVHNWCGDVRQPKGEDMGIFYSAARDPLFYAHHSNVDRMWTIWDTLPNHKTTQIRDNDWHNSSFYFYDEKKDLARVKVHDCLDNKKLGYDYQKVGIPWLPGPPTPQMFTTTRKEARNGKETIIGSNDFPVVLDKEVRVEIRRPNQEEGEEILVIEDIEIERDVFVKFDVYINYEGDDGVDALRPEFSEFVGSFVHLPHSCCKHGHKIQVYGWE